MLVSELILLHGGKAENTPQPLLGGSFILRDTVLWPVFANKASYVTYLAPGTRLKVQYVTETFIYFDIVHSYDSIAHITGDIFKECIAQNKLVPYCPGRYMTCLAGGKGDEESVGIRTIRRNMRINAAKSKNRNMNRNKQKPVLIK